MAAGAGGLALSLALAGSHFHENAALAQPPERATARRLVEAGFIPYVLGAFPDGRQILGGGHQLLIPSEPGREPIDAANQPSRLHPDLRGSYLVLDQNLRSGAADGRAFSSSWWPQLRNGVADRWNSRNRNYEDLTSDPDNLGPTEKYDLLFFPGQLARLPQVRSWSLEEMRRPERARGAPSVHPAITVAGPATKWELANHGLYQSVIPENWWGHCNGWSAYVSAEPGGAPMRDVRVKLAGGAVTECASGETGCVLFRMADIEALMSELYFNASSTASGRRCNTEPDKVRRDEYGRPREAACRDLNPGTMHVAMTGLLATGVSPLPGGGDGPRRPLSFIVDHHWDWQVWTYPVAKFSIDELEEVTGERAMQLVCDGRNVTNCGRYRFNENAVRFARVKARYWMVMNGGSGPWLLYPAARRNVPLKEEELHYVLEMNGAGRILGGEWIKDPMTNVNGKELHPDFLWIPVRAQGAGEDADDLGGTADNPFIAYSKVKALLNLATRPGSGG